MNEALTLSLAGLAGLAIGFSFFGGLWWTVRKSLLAAQPALWLLGSGLVRMGVAVIGFYLVSAHDFRRLLVCLGGFILARALVTRWTRPSPAPRSPLAAEASHAP